MSSAYRLAAKRHSKSLVSIARTKMSTTSRAAGRRDCPPGPWRPPVPLPHPLFPLFYQVEIRHRQLRHDVTALPGVRVPPASAEVTAFIAAAIAWAFSSPARRVG